MCFYNLCITREHDPSVMCAKRWIFLFRCFASVGKQLTPTAARVRMRRIFPAFLTKIQPEELLLTILALLSVIVFHVIE